jgi:acetyltransferase-like isoleucine patch superfamily enzyme
MAVHPAAARKALNLLKRGRRIEDYFNSSGSVDFVEGYVRAEPGVRILSSTFLGPAYLSANVRVGPNVTAGRYFAMNRDSFIANASVGNFTSIGARTSLNPFNHPTDWLSIHEFQYHKNAFNWVDEYRDMERLDYQDAPGARTTVAIGNDVWVGHNANVLAGVSISDGAILGAGTVVTKDVAAFAIMVGVPAHVVRFRFNDRQIGRLLRLRWWDLPLSRLSGLPFNEIERCLDRLEEIRAREDREAQDQ